jgi:hypothetical protein
MPAETEPDPAPKRRNVVVRTFGKIFGKRSPAKEPDRK